MPYYEFVVRGDREVDIEILEAETGMRCIRADRTARLDGELVDRAALHGVIERVFRLGLDLVAVERRSSHHVP